MISFQPRRPPERSAMRRFFAQTFQRVITALERDRLRWHVPLPVQRFERRPGMQYHFKPELFVQTAGRTRFTVPGDEGAFELLPGEVCVMPTGVPHGEVADDADGTAFENVVVCFYNETVAIHVARAGEGRRPVVDDIFFFTSEFFADLVEYLNRIAALQARRQEAAMKAVKGLLLAEFSLLLAIVEADAVELFSDKDKVSRCQWLIRHNLPDPSLGVESLAVELRCSADYLSKLFHRETGERLVEYVSRMRMRHALEAVRSTDLSVKEIAVACGYNDANYFARVFRKATGHSPGELRQQHRHLASTLEREPKAVFADREERDFGLRPEVMARAETRIVQ